MKFDNLDIDMLMKNLGLDYLHIKMLRENFVDDTINEIDVENVLHIFKYLNDNNIDYKHSEYIKNRSFLKRLIEKNKFITKIYCKIYSMLKTR